MAHTRETAMTTTPQAIADLTIEQLDAVITLTRADLTWCSPNETPAVWSAINQLLDQRNQLTQQP